MKPRQPVKPAILIATLVASIRCASGQSTPLSIDDCVRLALKAPSSVTVARQEQQIAGYGLRAARSSFLPQFEFNNSFTYNSSPLPSSLAGESGLRGIGSFVALNGIHEYQTLLGTMWEIDTSGRLRAALARARADQQVAAADLAIIQRDLRRAVAGAFFRVLLARHLAAANRDVLKEAESFAQRTRAMMNAGEVARADVVKAEAQVAFLAQNVNATELEASVANAELASFWTAGVNAELELADKLESPSPPELSPQEANVFLRRPEFSLLDAQRRGFEADYRHQRSFLFPQLTLNYQYGIDSNRLAIRDRGQAAFVSFNIPVFDWFRTRDLARQFRLQADQVGTRREIAMRELSRDYQNALTRTRQIYAQIGMAQTQVRTSRENLELSRVRYEGGEGPALDVVAAQSQLAQALTNYYTALASYAAARIELEVASGR
jgi:outer membrane protein